MKPIKRDHWLFWTNEHALRIAGHRMGPNRVRRLRRQDRRLTRAVQGSLSNTAYKGLI